VKNTPNDGFIRFPGLFNRDMLLVTSPKALGEILVTKSYSFEKPERARGFLRLFLGDGLVVTEGDQHKFQRKNTMPVFSFRHIKDLYPMMWTKAVGLIAQVEKQAEGRQTQQVDLSTWSTKATMDAIGVAGLGRELNTIVNSDDPLIHNFEEITEPTIEKVVYAAIGLIAGPTFLQMLPWEINRRMKITTSSIRQICQDMVASKKEAIEKRGDQNLDILSHLIRSNNFADDELIDQMLTFLAAG
jgi:cytochrome P450